jgi:hypothetical protein
MTAAVFALMQVMDKEAAPSLVWAVSLGVGAAGYFAARWRRRTAFLTVAALGVALAFPVNELLDPVVGPAIRAETGGTYGGHLVAAAAVGLVMIAVGTRRSSRGAA